MEEKDKFKLSEIENLLYLLAEKNYRNGFPYFNKHFCKRIKLYKPLFFNILLALYAFREFISIFITNDFHSLIIGDFVHRYGFSMIWKLLVINCHYVLAFTQLADYFVVKDNKIFAKFVQNSFNEKFSGRRQTTK